MRPFMRVVAAERSEVADRVVDHEFRNGMHLVMRLIMGAGATIATSGSWAKGINVPIVPRNLPLSIS